MTADPRPDPQGDPAAPSARPRGRLGAWWVLGATMVVGLALCAVGQIRQGGLVCAGGFLAAALIRALVDTDRIGALPVRSRALDVAMFVAMGAILLVAVFAVRLDGNP